MGSQSGGQPTEKPQEAGGNLDKHLMSLYGAEVGGGPKEFQGRDIID